jgi:septal ring factor EnvC (AmiA/AmiB activator)
MAEDLNKKVDELEAAAKKYASKDTVISIGGYEFTPAKLMIAFTIVSSSLGGLYGTFEIYKDYMGMKKKIADYITPDLSEFDKRLAVIEQNSAKTSDYTRDIKNDLKNDLRRNETVTEQIERSVKQSQRETDTDLKSIQKDLRASLDRTREDMEKLKRDTDARLEKVSRDVDSKIQKAIDNPLANK